MDMKANQHTTIQQYTNNAFNIRQQKTTWINKKDDYEEPIHENIKKKKIHKHAFHKKNTKTKNNLRTIQHVDEDEEK